MKKDLTETELVGDKYHPLESMVEEDNCIALSENKSSVSCLQEIHQALGLKIHYNIL